MGRCTCMQWVARITYFVGWIALLCGGLVHIRLARTLFTAVDLSKRNLFELSMACFVICIASSLQSCHSDCKTKEASCATNKTA